LAPPKKPGRPKKPTDFAALAAAIGLDDPNKLVAASKAKEPWGDDQAYAAEARLKFHNEKKAFESKTCKTCGRQFFADYAFVSQCSNACRKKALRDIGIEWDENRPYEERWLPARPPLIVTDRAAEIGEIPGQLSLF
jgi:ferredoxin